MHVPVPVRALTLALLSPVLVLVHVHARPCLSTPRVHVRAGTSLADYVGRYSQAESVVTFSLVADQLYVRPVEWSGRQPLEPIASDRFQMQGRPARTFAFSRSSDGRVAAVEIAGMDVNGAFRRMGPEKLPLEVLAEGRGASAWAAFRRRGVPAAEHAGRQAGLGLGAAFPVGRRLRDAERR